MVQERERLNWAMKKHLADIELLPLEYPKDFIQLLIAKDIPINNKRNQSRMLIDWPSVSPHYTIPYFDEISEGTIRLALSNSEFARCKNVIVEYGYDWPTVKIVTSKFILHWHDFIFSAELGSVVMADNLPLVLEFDDDSTYLLHSNFKLPQSKNQNS